MILPFPSGKDAAPQPALRRIATRQQRTLAKPISMRGVGFITGVNVHVKLLPAPADTGLVFVRTDLPNSPVLPARADMVIDTNRRTTLGIGNVQVTLVEHLLASLAGLKIDNCRIELDACEPPGLDGSARAFVSAITSSGIVQQVAERTIWGITRPIKVEKGDASLSFHPGDTRQLELNYRLDYGPRSPIQPQSFAMPLTPQNFEHELSQCRTFVLESEASALLALGIGKHLKASELLVFGAKGKLIDNSLRFSNEPARHKMLDFVGDIALSGIELVGQILAYRSGHPLNVQLARSILDLHEKALQKENRRAA